MSQAQRSAFTRAVTRYAAYLGRELHELAA